MAESTLWWLLVGAAITIELVTGTFYLLMLATSLAPARPPHTPAPRFGPSSCWPPLSAAGPSSPGTCIAGGALPTPLPARIWTDTFGRFLYSAAADGTVRVQTLDPATGLPGAPRAAAPVPIATMGADFVLFAR